MITLLAQGHPSNSLEVQDGCDTSWLKVNLCFPPMRPAHSIRATQPSQDATCQY